MYDFCMTKNFAPHPLEKYICFQNLAYLFFKSNSKAFYN